MEKNIYDDSRIRVELELDHMSSGVPLTGKLRIIVWDLSPMNDSVKSIHHATVEFSDGTFRIEADKEGMPLFPDALHRNLNDTMRAIYKTINGQSTHYIWYLGGQ